MEKTNKVICFTGHRIQFVKQYKTGIDHYPSIMTIFSL